MMKKRIKRISCYLILMCVLLTGCGKKLSEEIDITDVTDISVIEEADVCDQEIEEDESVSDVEYLICNDFSDGLALLYTQADGGYYSFVDQMGKTQICVDINIIEGEVSSFSEGYAYIKTASKIYIINKAGQITSSYDISTDIEVLAYGGGYVVTQEYISNFDEAYYLIKVWNSEGVAINELAVANGEVASYLGKGVFYFKNFQTNFYCALTNKWATSVMDDHNVRFYQDIAITGVDCMDPDDPNNGGVRGQMYFLDTSGNVYVENLYPENGWNWRISSIVNDTCVLYDFINDQLILYNYNTASFKMLSDYCDKIDWDAVEDANLIVDDARIAIPMIGSDGNNYVSIFDTDWNMICEPIIMADYNEHGEPYYGFSNGRLVVKDLNNIGIYHIYDENGNMIFDIDLSTCAYKYIVNGFSEGILFGGIEEGVPRYFDVDGNLLFDRIDSSNASVIDLP